MTPRTPRYLALLFALLAIVASAAPQLGLQSWTCNRMTFDEVVAFAEKHGLKELQLIAPAHIDPAAAPAENLRKKALLEAKGLHLYTIGVVGTSLDKEQNRKLFEFGKLMGLKMIVVEPKDQAEWDNLEQLVREYDIKLAIHNHGTGTVYGDPATVKAVLAKRDARIGVCLDIGWITAAGFDAAEVFRGYGDRVFDLHFKDKQVTPGADGKPVAVDTEIGQGSANYRGLFAAIAQTKWSGVMAIETDSRAFQTNPELIVPKAKAYFVQQLAVAP